jgi:DNA-binding GntR family transcriptional regulator
MPDADPAYPGSQTNYARIAELIRNDVFDGAYKSGEKLKTADLSRRYKVSPAPIREALQLLAGERLVTLVPNRGAIVQEVDRRLFLHVCNIREAVEVFQSRAFALHADARQVAGLAAAVAAFEAAVAGGYGKEASLANKALHAHISGFDGNEEAVAISTRHHVVVHMIRAKYGLSQGRLDQAVAEHREILQAVEARDGDAAAAIADRLERAEAAAAAGAAAK